MRFYYQEITQQQALLRRIPTPHRAAQSFAVMVDQFKQFMELHQLRVKFVPAL